MENVERFDFIEFRMDLLREGTEFCKYLYDCKITREQLNELYSVMDYCRSKVDNNEEISSAEYETKVLAIVDNMMLDYHFCEDFARLLWEEHRYEEVFPALYSQANKFKHLFK